MMRIALALAVLAGAVLAYPLCKLLEKCQNRRAMRETLSRLAAEAWVRNMEACARSNYLCQLAKGGSGALAGDARGEVDRPTTGEAMKVKIVKPDGTIIEAEGGGDDLDRLLARLDPPLFGSARRRRRPKSHGPARC